MGPWPQGGIMAPHLAVAVWITLQVIISFGFVCLVLSQRIKPATDIFQAWITAFFVSMSKKVLKCYINDVLCMQGETF